MERGCFAEHGEAQPAGSLPQGEQHHIEGFMHSEGVRERVGSDASLPSYWPMTSLIGRRSTLELNR